MDSKLFISQKNIEKKIYTIRGLRVMLDSDLAKLYEVETRALNQAVKGNFSRFPASFIFQLTQEEAINLKSQFVISSSETLNTNDSWGVNFGQRLEKRTGGIS